MHFFDPATRRGARPARCGRAGRAPSGRLDAWTSYDLPLDELRTYRTAAKPPDDLDDFWQSAIAEADARAFEPTLEPYRAEAYRGLDVADVTFAGADGDPIRAWYLRPAGRGRRRRFPAASPSSATAAAATCPQRTRSTRRAATPPS